jgi:hypothetical protein
MRTSSRKAVSRFSENSQSLGQIKRPNNNNTIRPTSSHLVMAVRLACVVSCFAAAPAALGQQADTFNPPVLHGLDQNNSASVTETAQPAQNVAGYTQATSPVEAFFQIAPTVQANPVPQAKTHSGAYRAIWHVMDNIGVPMFGNKDPDIDPALSRPFVMPPVLPDASANSANAANNSQTKPPKPTIIDPQAAAQDPSQMAPDDTPSKASSVNKSISNPQ